ncbi:hypothetical protein WICPIJ_002216 [Wickerhamomyces pijperi]|uniref:Uncharacterized protein n=1 Tax=Wickerhamomyces pijperi TaxID=599730 RepID=A0A9P8QC93_WICPI|nr:hypothetical protein WICPIJ_002216 [Wickerhamomyces pijperi]
MNSVADSISCFLFSADQLNSSPKTLTTPSTESTAALESKKANLVLLAKKSTGVLTSDPGPSRKHVFSSDWELDVVLQLLQDILDISLGRGRVLWDFLQWHVGGTSENLPLPWQEEHDSAVGGLGVQDPQVLRTVVLRQDNVHTGGRNNHLWWLWHGWWQPLWILVHFQNHIGVRTSGVDDGGGVDLVLLPGLTVLGNGTDNLVLVVFQELGDFDVVQHSGAVLNGGDSERGVESGIVERPIVVHQTGLQTRGFQLWTGSSGAGRTQQVGRSEVLGPSEQVVHLGTDVEIQLGLGQLPEGLLQISDTTVGHLGGFRGGTGGKIVSFHKGNVQTSGGGINSGTGTSGTTTDN